MEESELFVAISEIEIPDYVHEFIRRLNTIHLPDSKESAFPTITNLLDALIEKSPKGTIKI